jgi:hypothetical protein
VHRDARPLEDGRSAEHVRGARHDPAGLAQLALAALERQLAKGAKALVGNTGYRPYLETIRQDHFAIDPDKVEEDKRFDGIFVLRTNLNPLEATLFGLRLGHPAHLWPSAAGSSAAWRARSRSCCCRRWESIQNMAAGAPSTWAGRVSLGDKAL